MKEGNKKRRGTKMRKAVLGMAIAVLFALAMTACGGSGGLKGTVWVGSYAIEMKASMYDFDRPELKLNVAEFDEKEAKVSVRTGYESYLVKGKEYSVSGKDMIIYTDNMKETQAIKNKEPSRYDASIIKGSIDKNTLKIRNVEFTKKTRAEADTIIQGVLKDYEKKRAEYEENVAKDNARWK
jgi:hypothetical protein